MKTALLVLALTALLTGGAQAANVLVWNYDSLDRWYDSDVGDSINSAYWVSQLLTEQGHNVTVAERSLPSSLLDYDAVFCLMGWYHC